MINFRKPLMLIFFFFPSPPFSHSHLWILDIFVTVYWWLVCVSVHAYIHYTCLCVHIPDDTAQIGKHLSLREHIATCLCMHEGVPGKPAIFFFFYLQSSPYSCWFKNKNKNKATNNCGVNSQQYSTCGFVCKARKRNQQWSFSNSFSMFCGFRCNSFLFRLISSSRY